MHTRSPLLLQLFLLLPMIANAQEAVGWRGDGSGVFASVDPPIEWSKEKNVCWATKMPGRSNSQPVITGNRLFVCSEPFTLLCLALSDGKILWQRSNSYRDVTSPAEWTKIEKELGVARKLKDQIAALESTTKELQTRLETAKETRLIDAELETVAKQTEQLETKLKTLSLAGRYTLPITQKQYNGYTTATPTTDGEHVWVVFGNRVVVCYDTDGNRQWSTVLPDHPQAMWGHTTSPLLSGDKLVVCIDEIAALDAKSGKLVWRTRHGQSWGSPVRGTIGGEDVIFMANGRVLRTSDGKVIAREAAPLERASPVVHGAAVYYIGLRGTAHDFPERIGDKLELKERWATDTKGGLYTASPVVHDGLVYTCSSKHILNVLDAETGATLYVKRLKLGHGPVWPSLCVAGKYVYVSSRDGTTLVLEAGRTYKEVARNELEFFISSPVFHNNRMYVRTNQHLYCIGES